MKMMQSRIPVWHYLRRQSSNIVNELFHKMLCEKKISLLLNFEVDESLLGTVIAFFFYHKTL